MKKFGRNFIALLFAVFCLVTVSKTAADTYQSDFCNQVGTWKDMVGLSTRQISLGQFSISNQKVGTSYESIALNTDAGMRSSGDLEFTFVYNGQTNFGLVFRAGANNSTNYQSFAYTKAGNWQLGQPGGKWITTITSPALVTGNTYRLLVRYQGTSFQAYLNGNLIYDNPNVTYADGSSINGDWSGNIGLRLFGNLSQLTILSMKSGDVNSLPNQIDLSQFASMRDKWKKQLVSDQYDGADASVVKYVQNLSDTAITLYQSMDKSTNRTTLWALKAGDTPSADLTTQFTNLYNLALAYGTQGTSYYQNTDVLSAIKGGLDFMTTQKGYDGTKYYGNWWDFQVGIPQKFINILMIIGAQLSPDTIQSYTNIIHQYVPNSYQQLYTKPQGTFVSLSFIPNFVTTGANRTDLALSVLGMGILQNNPNWVELSSNSIKDVFKLVTQGDGFYADGSFIQHNNIAYTGSYGNVLVKGVGQILAITKGSTFEMDAQTAYRFVNTVEDSFIPLIYRGMMLPGVNGRSISRAPTATQIGYGSTTMYNLLIVAELAPSDAQKKLQEAVKYWMLQNPDYYLNNVRDYNDLQMTLSLMNDSSVAGSTLPFVGTKLFASMDRFVQRTPDYMASLSMYSNRISSFEAGNGENKHGWHTADGMFYLYNDDEVQFGNSYWPTVDPYRLPGTTVDTVALQDENSSFTTVTSPENWVGGVAAENQAVVGMALNKQGTQNNGTLLPMNLKAKKSWFVMDGQIVSLGAGITGSTSADIETIVDDRLLNEHYQYQVISDNGPITTENEQSQKNWLLLASDHVNASIGYYFPTGENVNVVSETRTGTYRAINSAFPSDTEYVGNYRKFIINHGSNPVNATYAYVTLPGISQDDLAAYAQKRPVNILSNTENIQAVQVLDNHYLGINFWGAVGGTIAGISTDKPISLMKQDGAQTTYTIADPTQSNALVHVQLPKDSSQVISMSDGMTFDSTTNTLTIDFTNCAGSSKQLVVQ